MNGRPPVSQGGRHGVVPLLAGALSLYAPSSLAYLDPGQGSLFLQLLLGGLAGVIVAVKLYWNRITRRFRQPPPDGGDSGGTD